MIIEPPNSVDSLTVGCILVYNRKLLLLHRKKDDKWRSVNGIFEDEDKSVSISVKRKIQEILGLNIEPRFFTITYHNYNEKNVAYYIFNYDFNNDPSDMIKLDNENDKFGFFTFEEALKLNLFEDEDYCLKLFKEKGYGN